LLGFAYIAVEVNLIQKFSLFLGHPSYSLTTTLATMLAASRFGSLLSGQWKIAENKKVALAVAVITAFVIVASLGIAPLFDTLIALPLTFRLLVAVLIISIPGFFMGIPFPVGLSTIKRRVSDFVPWAWALNSGATVIGTLGALLLAMTMGFQLVFLVAAGMYLGALLVFMTFYR
jgi:hypothetical protein